MWVSACTRWAKPRISEPPPASRMPWRTMSPASSGGVSSSVAWMAARTSGSGEAIAARTSWLVSRGLGGERVAATHVALELGLQGRRGTDCELDRLRALGADRHHVLVPDVRAD